jgi:putative oxidoreductase
MTSPRSQDLGKLILRISVGALLFLHGIFKIDHGVAWMIQDLHDAHLPAFLRFGVYFGEVVGPLLVLAGFASRVGGWLIAFNMLMATYLSHRHQIFQRGPAGGSRIELDLLYLLGGVAIALLGAGEYSVSRGRGRLD